jgi:hypothetical protein
MKERPSQSDLQMVRDFWTAAAIQWAQTAPYNFGPIDELLIENNFHYFPINPTKIQSNLNKYTGEDNFIHTLGSNIRGLGALEYLLFSEKAVSNSNTFAFAKMLSQNLVNLNQELVNQWKSNYAKTFTSNTGNNINSSITALTNQWIAIVENVKNNKIGMPAGKIAGTNKNLLTVQCPYSNTSLSMIAANLSALKMSFNGGTGNGIDDYLNVLNISDQNNLALSKKINDKLDALIQLLRDENASLSELIQNDAEKLDPIYLEILNLTILLKTDLMGQLGLITTFSDSDGD